jgi:hypothetical protein
MTQSTAEKIVKRGLYLVGAAVGIAVIYLRGVEPLRIL